MENQSKFPQTFPLHQTLCVKDDDDDDFEDHHEKRVEKECEFEVSQIVLLAFARFSRFF